MVTSEYEDTHVSLEVIKARAAEAWQFTRTVSNTAMKKIRKGAKIIVRPILEKDPKVGLFQLAPTFSGNIPIVAQGCQQNDVLAINNRVLCETLPASDEAWRTIRNNRLSRGTVDYEKIRDEIDFDTQRAFEKWNEGFSGPRAAQQVEAWERLKCDPLEKDHLIKKTFSKCEKLSKSNADYYQDWTPRAIQGSTHEANVVLSPFVSQYSKGLAKQWNGMGKFYYTSGATVTDLGRWLARWYYYGDWFIEVDFSSYDGTQGRQVHEMIDMNFTKAGIDDFGEARTVLDGLHHFEGRTNTGVRYFVPYGMASGRPDTSCSNSDTTGVGAEYVIEEVFGSSEDTHIAALGDDNLTILPARYMVGRDKNEVRESIIAHFATLGFVAKVKVTQDVCMAEFCSGVFWPCVVNGVETYVLGQKPGRALRKIGFSLVKHDLGTVKGMFLGHRAACNHVPVLRVYIDCVLSKLENVTAKVYIDSESKYKHSLANASEEVRQSVHLGDFFYERYGLDLKIVEHSLYCKMASMSLQDTFFWEYMAPLVEIDC